MTLAPAPASVRPAAPLRARRFGLLVVGALALAACGSSKATSAATTAAAATTTVATTTVATTTATVTTAAGADTTADTSTPTTAGPPAPTTTLPADPVAATKIVLQAIFGTPRADAPAGGGTTTTVAGDSFFTQTQFDCMVKSVSSSGLTSAQIGSLQASASDPAAEKAGVLGLKTCLEKDTMLTLMANNIASGSQASTVSADKIKCVATQLYDHFDLYLAIGAAVQTQSTVAPADTASVKTAVSSCQLTDAEFTAVLAL